ncbi:hypothetical protein Tco_0934332 [Tanacetum coccineum]
MWSSINSINDNNKEESDKKRLKKYVDYEQLTDVLAMYKSVLEEEFRATKSKLKLYDRCYVCNVRIFVNVKFGMQMKYKCRMCKMVCKMFMVKFWNANCMQMQAANANASFKCKFKLQMQYASCKRNLQMQMQSANVHG